MSQFPIDNRNKVSQIPAQASYDKSTINKIIDEALFCHVGFIADERPYVIPIIHARMGDNIILHGSKTSRLINHIQAGKEVCITVTLLDELVLARSACHHSMNYRSVVLFGRGKTVDGNNEKHEALKTLTEHIVSGRWNDIRKPNQEELDAIAIVSIPIEVASAKIRTGPPKDDPDDYGLPIWAGVLPLKLQALDPEDDPQLGIGISRPVYISDYQR